MTDGRTADASSVATMAALEQTAPDSEGNSTGSVELGSEGNDANLLTDRGVKRACAVGRGKSTHRYVVRPSLLLYVLL